MATPDRHHNLPGVWVMTIRLDLCIHSLNLTDSHPLSLNPSSGIRRVRRPHQNTPLGGGLAELSPQPALTPRDLAHPRSMRCPLDFIVGSAMAAKAACKFINIIIVCHSWDMLSVFRGSEDLHARREGIIVVRLHA